MIKRLLILSALFVFGCNTTDSTKPDTIAPGIYEGTVVINGVSVKTQQVFTQDHKYDITGYIDCQILLRTGTWSYADETLSTPIESSNARNNCSSEMAPDVATPITFTFLVRNLQSNSFEMLWLATPTSATQWVKYQPI